MEVGYELRTGQLPFPCFGSTSKLPEDRNVLAIGNYVRLDVKPLKGVQSWLHDGRSSLSERIRVKTCYYRWLLLEAKETKLVKENVIQT